MLTDEIFSMLDEELRGLDGARCVIGIGGESGSGKSVTATCLATALKKRNVSADILHLDDYFILPPLQNHYKRKADLGHVGIQEVDMVLLQENIDNFLNGASAIKAPLVDFEQDTKTYRTVSLADVQVLIVEGTYALSLQHLSSRIFLSRDYKDTRQLRALRNRDTHVEAELVDRILAIEHNIIKQYAVSASILIDKQYRVIRQVHNQRKSA